MSSCDILGDPSLEERRTGVKRGYPPPSLWLAGLTGHSRLGTWLAGKRPPSPSCLGLHGTPSDQGQPLSRVLSVQPGLQPQSPETQLRLWPLQGSQGCGASPPQAQGWTPASPREAAVFTLQKPSFYSLRSVFRRREPTRTHTPSDAPDHTGSQPSRRCAPPVPSTGCAS